MELPPTDFEYDEMAVAKAWGLTPRQWRMESVDDRARMMTHDYIEGIRSMYRYHQGKKKAGGRKSEVGGQSAENSGMDRFLAYKRKMGWKV